MAKQRVSAFAPIAVIVVGVLFVLVGAVRPDFLWTMGKLERGRAVIGDGVVSVLFVGLGIALVALAGILLVRSRATPPD